MKLFAAKDMRNYIGCKYFLVDISCIEEQLDDFIVALQSMQMMLNMRIIPILSDMVNADAYIGRLVDIGVTDIVTADSMDGIRDELAECLSEDGGMQRYKRSSESFKQDTAFEEAPKPKEIVKYKWNSRNVKIAIAGTQRRSGVTVTAFNLAAWLIARGASACYVETNTNRHLNWIVNIYDAEKDGEAYPVGGVDCYFTNELDKDYNFVIYDCGEFKEPTTIFREADIRLLCGSILPHEAKDYLQVLNACKDMDIYKLGLCVPKPLQEFCRESLNKEILIAESSHDLFENNINGHIYLPMVKRFIIIYKFG
ncbi:hypothetical protein [Desulfosporosinus sp. BG]|uniref:hypothetical protein n=1 Tax=Desulfosporosinus sp. BG TaxID=1633135 RepID=UPI001FA707EB|nr:hypothetical protein [Desulfosporosinus sp. BG]